MPSAAFRVGWRADPIRMIRPRIDWKGGFRRKVVVQQAPAPGRLPANQRPGNSPFGLTARRLSGKHVAMGDEGIVGSGEHDTKPSTELSQDATEEETSGSPPGPEQHHRKRSHPLSPRIKARGSGVKYPGRLAEVRVGATVRGSPRQAALLGHPHDRAAWPTSQAHTKASLNRRSLQGRQSMFLRRHDLGATRCPRGECGLMQGALPFRGRYPFAPENTR